MQTDLDFDVLIVGAGIAGGALARGLSGRGLSLALVEANPISIRLDPPADAVAGYDARVSAIAPASQALFEGLGAWAKALAAGPCPYRHMQVWDAEGTGAIEFHAEELDAPVLGHIVENRILTSALLEGIETAGVVLFNPARPAAFRRDERRRPCLRLEDGREIRASLLVAADGALSPVRKLAGFGTREWDYGHRALVATVRTEYPHGGCAFQRFMPSGPLAFLPLASAGGNHYCSVVWSAQPERARALLELDDEAFREEVGAALEYRLGRVLAASSRLGFPLRQRHATDYVQPGIALIGDAAHTIHPLAGQGINLGLRDVAALTEELLAGHERGLAPGELAVLRRYQRRRKAENLLMMAAMDGFKRLFGETALPVRWLRNTGMRLVGRAGPLKRRIMRHAMGVR